MKKFNKLTVKTAKIFQAILVIAMSLLGIVLVLLLFREFLPIIQHLISPSISKSNVEILDELIVFFLFFEFIAMIVSALRNHGHMSINFLMELGITALLRSLITAHASAIETLGSAAAILILIIGMVIFNRCYYRKKK
ncbi:phosphate-starvation-inducible protein PsiE [Lactobacillus sp.]|uniref:phosphate-starvation-inducible protein PsiE n=1 Tax=Lactobacillus sp. TaxID=1591 RepID=UPI0019BC1843|nr:phosphate-starvation-inducible protein PsiE [Lactobacillus sp.]MBD5429550.1 phosphate-starvation-inducible protein PsiE [Lactobacillus sp.]